MSKKVKTSIKGDFIMPFKRPEISLDECRSILCKLGQIYSDREIEEIRELMLNLAEIEYSIFKKKQISKKEKDVR